VGDSWLMETQVGSAEKVTRTGEELGHICRPQWWTVVTAGFEPRVAHKGCGHAWKLCIKVCGGLEV
jgi:hypothetical protein